MGLPENDFMIFSPEVSAPAAVRWDHPWEILVVDDDAEVHKVTRLLLKDYVLDGQGVVLASAYSGKEAMDYMADHPDTALVLLDVVMETEDAGLRLVRWIRDVWQNAAVRIILRTGQPGAAPEKQVIQEYRINDYKSKTDLTELKLFTAVTVALRSFQDLMVIKRSEEGFRRIVQASGELFRKRSAEQFYTGILMQFTGLMRLDEDSLFLRSEVVSLHHGTERMGVLAGTGKYESWEGEVFDPRREPGLEDLVTRALAEKYSYFEGHWFIHYFMSQGGKENVLIFRSASGFRIPDREILQIFSETVAIAFSNHD